MANLEYPRPILEAVEALRRLPGIGNRGAERMALWLARHPDGFAKALAESLLALSSQVVLCPECGFFQGPEGCPHCLDHRRDPALWCVVEQPSDMLPLARSGAFPGRFLSLGGRLSPLDHIGPSDLRFGPLLRAVERGEVREVILALGSEVEGEATAHYLAGLLDGKPITVSRLAQGIPAASAWDTTDEITLARAVRYRRPMNAEES